MIVNINKDVISNGKDRTVYAKAGEDVELIKKNGKAVICENSKGVRFSTTKDNIDED